MHPLLTTELTETASSGSPSYGGYNDVMVQKYYGRLVVSYKKIA